jgi:hypothetical protein
MPGAERLPGFFISASKSPSGGATHRGAPQRDLKSHRNPQGALTDAERIVVADHTVKAAFRKRNPDRSTLAIAGPARARPDNLAIADASGTRLGSGQFDDERCAKVFLNAEKSVTAIESAARGRAVVASLALHRGLTGTNAVRVAQSGGGCPAGSLGTLLDQLAEDEAASREAAIYPAWPRFAQCHLARTT